MTLFPDSMGAVLGESIIGRAAKKGAVEINCVQIRDYTENKQMQVDDYPYGGGWGLIMMAQPLKSCLDDVMSTANDRKSHVIYLTPQGKTFTQDTAKRLVSEYDHLVLVCGHYEGVDERFIEECVDEELSLGDFVLTGGELAAMAVTDCVCRLVPGVLADEECFTGESHWDGLLEYPQYTRPEIWEGHGVPEVLLCGDHAKITLWRRKKQLERTMDKRPDMFGELELAEKSDIDLLAEIEAERTPKSPELVFDCRRTTAADILALMEMAADASAYLCAQGVDQWQGDYPDAGIFEFDVHLSQGWLFTCEGEAAGYAAISMESEPSYDEIEGAWLTESDNYAVVHRSMIAGKYRGSPLAAEIFSLAEDLAAGFGKASVRVDTHCDNGPMHGLLKKMGYIYCGIILVDEASGHEPRRDAFEKIIL
ncbi:MAG: tRNA (guanosine(37)-N1)-methyltransferase TrmD [Clostridia bacterium]|nr:tRNA (guanosine(37)-N1)-methyltransferase TrmD [Clostridia bacterium]